MKLYVVQANGPRRGRALSGPHSTYEQARTALEGHIQFGVSLDIEDRDRTGNPDREHWEDEDYPGWCGVCGCAHPCPGTATAAEQSKIMARYVGGGRR